MDYLSIFWSTFVLLTIAVVFCSKKYSMLKDTSSAGVQPFSWARVQLAWWTVIVLTCFITILIEYHQAPDLWQSTVVLLGISAVTTTVARVIDISDAENPQILRGQDGPGENFVFDILSDGCGVTVHRFQAVIFNLVFGIYFLLRVANHLSGCVDKTCIDSIMPDIGTNSLILLGLSSATYAAMKVTENKSTTITPPAQAVPPVVPQIVPQVVAPVAPQVVAPVVPQVQAPVIAVPPAPVEAPPVGPTDGPPPAQAG